MRKMLSLMLALAVGFIAAGSPISTTTAAAMPDLTQKAKSAIKRLDQISGGTLSIQWNDSLKTPSIIMGKLSRPSNHSPQWIAYTFMERSRALYGLSKPSRDLRITQIHSAGDDITRVSLQRFLFGLPVLGDTLEIDLDKRGVIRRVEGKIHPNLEQRKFHRPTHPVIKEHEAIKTVLNAFPQYRFSSNSPAVQLYYLPTRRGMPLVYAVTLQHAEADTDADANAKPRIILVHAEMGHIIH